VSPVLFLLPIPIALVVGLMWASWVSRPPRPADPTVTVEQWSRAVRVLAPQAPAPYTESAAHRDRELARSA
jgi:hypothetical protein